MDFKRLRAFHSVCESSSIQRSARQLKLTSAAVSIQLKKLERELGAALFDHHPNKLVLTTKGRIFAGEVKSIFSTFDRAIATLSQDSDDYPMKLSLSVANDASRFFIPRIGSLIQNKPDLRINILLRSSSETLSLVQSGEIHFGIGRYQKLSAGIQKVALFEDRIMLIYPLNKPPRWLGRVRLEALATCRLFLLTRNSTTRKLIDASFMRKGVGVDDVIEVSTCQAGIEFVRLGLGMGLVHKICVSETQDKNIGVVDMRKFFRSSRSLIDISVPHAPGTNSRGV